MHFRRKLSSNVVLTTDRTQKKVEETLAHVRPVEEGLNRHIINTERIIPRFEQTSHNVAESLGKFDDMMRELLQIKDQSAMLIQQTSADVSKLDHADQACAQTASETGQILHDLRKLSSGVTHDRTSTMVGHIKAENTVAGVGKLPFNLKIPHKSI